MRKEVVEKIKKDYPKGMGIKLIKMNNEPQMPKGLLGEVKFVDDMGQIHVNWNNGSSLALNVDEDTFQKTKTIKVLSVKVGKTIKIELLEANLDSYQKFVGGLIEMLAPFEDEVAIICNEEGKINGLKPNKPIIVDGNLIDIIYGDFFVCYVPETSSTFESLPEELLEKYCLYFSRYSLLI